MINKILKERIAELDYKIKQLEQKLEDKNLEMIYARIYNADIRNLVGLKRLNENLYYSVNGLQ